MKIYYWNLQRHHIWSKSWCCVPMSCTQLWTNKTHYEEFFSISHQLTASSPFRTWHKLLQMEAQQHWTHSCNFKIKTKAASAEVWYERTKCYKVKVTCMLYLFCWWGICVQLQAPRKQITLVTGNILVRRGGHPPAPVTYLIATSEISTVVAMATATQHKQHSHADLNICIKPPIRSPAQTHVLEFNCLPLSYFHSQIPKTYTFQTWYSRSLCHSFLCLQSPCHHNSNARHNLATQCLQHSPWADSGVVNIMSQLAYEHVNKKTPWP
jgi:hypothetical protein